jgi:5'-nucleotidase
MVGFIRKASYGLLSIKPRDRRGRPIGDTRKGIIDADPATPGIQELKEWTALASYLKELPDTDKDGIPDLPSRYGRPEGRFAAVPSWDPVALLAGGNWITWGAILAAVLLLFAALSLLAIVVRLLRRRLGSPGSFS